ncbi:YSIRK-type signal peptide-containing protein [Staphylococcus delphini]|uniref:YSIRK-type signal peptide-containing protein n=1 Tax=Staphylococcus delphini TaxID=53344 RepID=UPI0021D23D1D|nr:YSIRK-type signal peptide-containing protein [Staphylococcus delphini]UXS44281.1 YSIRK-type signal peptide-containing protein [Staphylococcus delphini]UXV44908.1 YSIRK-type signal peptide-containing protein [Staphylococcus delphini]
MLKENYKLRKLKVGLVSTAAAMIFVVSNGTAEASENTETEVKTEEQSVASEEKEGVSESVAPQQAQAIQLDEVRPGDTQVTGYTQPNKAISIKIDNKDIVSLDEDYEEVVSDDEGKFTYDLKGRKIVYNQKVDVEATAPLNLEELDEEVLESDESDNLDVLGELEDEESIETSVTTLRYENAYTVPEKRLEPMADQHQVWIEPVLEGSGVIKGHTSVNGKVALAINNQHVNLGDKPEKLETLNDAQWQERYDGIWRQINDKGFFEFDLNRLYNKSYSLHAGDVVTLTFKSDDANDALGPVVFNVRTEPFERVADAQTVYQLSEHPAIEKLADVAQGIEVQPILGDVLYSETRGDHKVIVEGTKKVEGRTQYGNSIIQIDSNLGEHRSFPTLQADASGHFTFDLKEAGTQLLNGEVLTFKVLDPHTSQVLAETTMGIHPADKKDRASENDYLYGPLTEAQKAKLRAEILRPMVFDATDDLDPDAEWADDMEEVDPDAVPTVEKVDENVAAASTDEMVDVTAETKENGEVDANTASTATPIDEADKEMQTSETDKEAASSENDTTSPITDVTLPSPVEPSNNNEVMNTTAIENMGDKADMVRFQNRLPLLQMMQSQGTKDTPTLMLKWNGTTERMMDVTQAMSQETVAKPTAVKVSKKSFTAKQEALPHTGSTTKVSLWSVLMLASGAALLGYKRRRQS